MAETGNRVEVRYGAFSCTIEGYEDPVGQMREVLALMQRMISDTPALADDDTGLDDDRFERLDRALADRRAEDLGEGTVVIRSGHRVAGDAEDAVILADSAEPEGDSPKDAASPQASAAEPGQHPAAAIYAAPAAAVAEAAFAAGMANDDADEREGQAQAPLGEDVPEDPATPAALFAAPAADVAETVFADDSDGTPAEHGAEGAEGDGRRDPAAEDQIPDAPADAAPRASGDHWAAPEPTPERDDVEHDDGSGWTGRTSRDGHRGSGQGPAEGFSEDGDADGTGSVDGRPADARSVAEDRIWARATTAGEPPPEVNIFAPPPDETLERGQDDGEAIVIAGRAELPASPRRAPHRAAASDHHLAPTGANVAPDEDDVDGEGDDLPDDGAGDWSASIGPRASPVPAERRPLDADRDDPSDSTENRLAALITRYQTGMSGREADAAPETGTSAISAAELAERAGAVEVADLLAVSAAWLTLAGGRAKFSRREVMEVFEGLPGDHPRTLEARIKGFGNVVRSGVLTLVEDGAFAMPPQERDRFGALIAQR